MADRYEPKVSVRPLSERRPAQTSAENDPLVELARIVTGRTTFDAPPADKAKPAASPGGGGDLSRDLESELLSDLQASFTTIREAVAAAPPPPSAPPPQPKPQSVAPAAPRPRPEVPVRERVAPRPVPAPPTLTADPAAELEVEKQPLRPPVTERTERPAPVLRAPSQPLVRPPAPPPARPELSNPRYELPAFLRTPRGESPARADPASPPPRAVPPARTPEPVVRPSSRWKRPEEPLPPHAEAGRAITSRVPPPRQEQPSENDLDAMSDEFDEGVAFAEEEFPVDQGGPFEDDFALEDLQTTAYNNSDDDLPPFPEDELASLGRRRSRRTFAAIGAVVAIVVAGGLGVYLFRADSTTGTPPIIAADATPTKVAPEEPATATGETDPQAKLIYDRVQDGKANDQTTLVTPGDEPIADIPPMPEETAANPISRVIIPGGPGIDGPIAETAADDPAAPAEEATGDTASADDPDTAIGPRKVRTVVVRPDGTIVSSEATAVDEDGNAPAAAVPDPTDPALTVQSDRTQMDDVLEGQSLPVNPDPLGAQPLPSDAPAGTVPAAEAVPEPPASAADAANTEAFPDPPAATPADAPAADIASNDNPDAAIDLTPTPPVKAKPKPKAPAAAAATGGGTLVQISSQRSEEAARSTFRDLQARYPNILGSYKPNIQRADLGDRGVYYRVRVGPFAGNDAVRLCESLKSAGGDCIVAR